MLMIFFWDHLQTLLKGSGNSSLVPVVLICKNLMQDLRFSRRPRFISRYSGL